MNLTGEDWVKKLDLQEHPEGGYYKETYRSLDLVNQDGSLDKYNSSRNASTAIYYLLIDQDFSRFHKLKSDEIFHFYSGSTLDVHLISEQGKYTNYKLGNNPHHDEILQLVIPQQTWFACGVSEPKSYSLIGCTVAPGFDFDDFVMAQRKSLIELYPQHEDIIKKFTH